MDEQPRSESHEQAVEKSIHDRPGRDRGDGENGTKPMKLGILADIHEQTRELRKAIDVLQQHRVDRFVVLGDVFETGKRIEQGCALFDTETGGAISIRGELTCDWTPSPGCR